MSSQWAKYTEQFEFDRMALLPTKNGNLMEK
eukprot:CAMPEP_0196205164 /NCGR_PEP_ID=MMETSP0912-20130531/7020_1 /TAXON_ID=49265 /ORGANISM="Thalassiosira rotula, Strain GSO102" /LENGTH=30 /DNA_ID= /DNA_START= /DNA_END= /DNA_ORIENTATION=